LADQQYPDRTSGAVQGAGGRINVINQGFEQYATLIGSSGGGAAAVAQVCPILELDIGPIFLNLHGLPSPMHYLDDASALVDVVVILSLFWSAFIGNLAFLRVLRTVRLLRSYNVLGRLKQLLPAVRRHEG
jgi:Ion transport protein